MTSFAIIGTPFASLLKKIISIIAGSTKWTSFTGFAGGVPAFITTSINNILHITPEIITIPAASADKAAVAVTIPKTFNALITAEIITIPAASTDKAAVAGRTTPRTAHASIIVIFIGII